MNIGILCSGSLGFALLQRIVDTQKVVCVFTDKASVKIIDYCNTRRLPMFIGNPRGNAGSDFIKSFCIDVLVSVNYLFLIERSVYLHASKLAFNVHGSLLPKYRGRTPHVWAIINNEK